MIYGKLSLVKNNDGSYDLVIDYPKHDAEFGADFLSPKRLATAGGHVREYLRGIAYGLKIRRAKILVGGVLVAVLPFQLLTSALAGGRYNMGYLYVGSPSQQIQHVQNTQDTLNTVSPSYFDIKGDGTLQLNAPNQKLIDAMHSSGIRVVPFLSNHWDRDAGIRALEQREDLVRQLAAYVEEYELDGVNVDLENLTPAERDSFSEFVLLLREAIPPEKEVSVAVAANPRGVDTGWAGSYDYAALGDAADHLVMMTYDEHYQGGPQGPVASISFVEDAIGYALSQTPSEKIVIGIPLYGRIWSDDGNFQGHSVQLKAVEDLVQTYSAQITFDEEAQSPRAEFTVEPEDPSTSINGKRLEPGSYTLWYENEESVRAKLDLIDRYDLKGAASWSLGQEDPALWEVYREWAFGEGGQELPDEGDEDAGQEGDGDAEAPTVTAPSIPGGNTGSTSGGGKGSASKGSGGSSGGGGGGSSGVQLAGGASTAAPVPASPASLLKRTGHIVVDQAPVHREMSMQSKTLDNLGKGRLVTIAKKTDDWYQVTLEGGKTGYIPEAAMIQHATGTVSKEGLKLYREADTAAAPLQALAPGTPMTIFSESNAGWSRVRLADGTTGYLPTEDITKVSRTQPIAVKTTAKALRLRATPSRDALGLGNLPKGVKVVVLEEVEGYVKIGYGATTAYVTAGYLA